jgi:CxxC-x17-CxxC domain-containing protein
MTRKFEDKIIRCRDCEADFTHTAGDQEFYESKGFTNEPTRCKPCRQRRKQDGGSSYDRSSGYSSGGSYGGGGGGGSYDRRSQGGSRQEFVTTCAECGGEARVNFEPRSGRPVLCASCFQRSRQRSY